MPENPTKKRSRWPAVVMALVLLLPLLYMASVGPAYYCSYRFSSSFVVANATYRPIAHLCAKNRATEQAYNRYLVFWLNRARADTEERVAVP